MSHSSEAWPSYSHIWLLTPRACMLSWVCGCMLVLGQSKLWPHDKPRACMLNMVCGCCRPSLCLLPLGRAALSDPDSVSLDHNLEPTATTHVVAATNLSHDNCDAMRLQNRFPPRRHVFFLASSQVSGRACASDARPRPSSSNCSN